MANPYFRFKQFEIRQDACAMKVGTLACIFGAWAGTEAPNRILDIGTGTGLLALMLAQRFAHSRIDAVEIDEKAAEQAAENFERSKWSDRIRIYGEDIRKFRTERGLRYDLIISNPPFFNNQTPTPDRRDNLARHGYALTLEQLAGKVAFLLQKGGSFYVLLPVEESRYLQSLLQKNRLHPFRRLYIYNRPATPVKALVTAYSFSERSIEDHEIMIWGEDGNYTPDYIHLMSDFYLYF